MSPPGNLGYPKRRHVPQDQCSGISCDILGGTLVPWRSSGDIVGTDGGSGTRIVVVLA
jgi:hypothetical protein